MRNGFQVSRAITIFNKKPLVVLESIWRPYDGIIESIGMKIFDQPLETMTTITRTVMITLALKVLNSSISLPLQICVSVSGSRQAPGKSPAL